MSKKNPYNPQYPSEPELFVGRSEQINRFKKRIDNAISTRRPSSSAILGIWGIGKSSLLLKLKSLVDQTEGCVTIKVSLGSDIRDYYTFCQFLVDKINLELTRNRKLSEKVRDSIFKWRFKEAKLGFLTLKKKEKSMYLSSGNMLVEYNIKTLWDNFLKDEVKLLSLYIDDIHNLTKRNRDALLALRDLFQGMVVDGYPVQLIFTAPRNLFYDVKTIAEPTIRFFEKFYLDRFTFEEAEEFLTKPLRESNSDVSFTDKAIGYLHKKTEGHPYFLAFIAKDLVDLKDRGGITHRFIEDKWVSLFRHLSEEKFEKDMMRTSMKQRELLTQIAKSRKEIVRPIEFKANDKYWKDLTESNLLIKVDRGRYKLYHHLFKEYLKQMK